MRADPRGLLDGTIIGIFRSYHNLYAKSVAKDELRYLFEINAFGCNSLPCRCRPIEVPNHQGFRPDRGKPDKRKTEESNRSFYGRHSERFWQNFRRFQEYTIKLYGGGEIEKVEKEARTESFEL